MVFGGMERMDEACMTKREGKANMENRTQRGRFGVGWMDNVKVAYVIED